MWVLQGPKLMIGEPPLSPTSTPGVSLPTQDPVPVHALLDLQGLGLWTRTTAYEVMKKARSAGALGASPCPP